MTKMEAEWEAASVAAFNVRLRRYLRARAAVDAYNAGEVEDGDLCDRLTDECGAAFEDIALRPADTRLALQWKISLLDQERIEDGWYRGREALALLAADAERLLARSYPVAMSGGGK